MLPRASILALLVGAGCASDEAVRKDVARLERQLLELRRRTDDDRHALHELENRVFVVEDKVDTAQVAQARGGAVPRLPVVTKAPEPESPAPPPAAAPEPPDDGAPAFVIRMDGRGQEPRLEPGGRSSTRRSPAEPPDLAAVNEKLPVIPMPPKASAGDGAMAEYRRAYEALGRREHAAAIAALRAFLERHPDHDYADNAQYWLGEAYYDQADYRTALVEFRAVLKRYPAGNKAPDALLKVGYCLAKLGDGGASSDVLAQVIEIYPRTDAARLAMRRLDEMRRVSR